MTNQAHIAIRHLERNVIGSRYLLEVYKIVHEINARPTANKRELAALLANTYLRSLILTLCVIFGRSNNASISTNLSLQKSLDNTFNKSKDMRPDLSEVMDNSIAILKNEKLDKLRNKKIAHLDLEETILSSTNSNPKNYEKLVNNAETIMAEILIANGFTAERTPPKPESDLALQQLRNIFE